MEEREKEKKTQDPYSGDCAYYGTDHNTSLQQHHGVTVIDASDPAHPVPSAYLDDTAAALVPHETVRWLPIYRPYGRRRCSLELSPTSLPHYRRESGGTRLFAR